MTTSENICLCGRFLSENSDDWLNAFHIVIDVKETHKSYILQLVEFDSRFSATHISLLFSKSKRVVLSKSKGGHAIRKWCNGTFTFYPFQAGIPYYFKRVPNVAGDEQKKPRKLFFPRKAVLSVSPWTAPITGTASAASLWFMTECLTSQKMTAAWSL